MADVVEEPKSNPNYLNGVFYFSNTSDEDFVALWNNIEYIFPANTCSPMLIPGQTPEEVQEIRKRFAYRWAEQQWYQGSEYKKMSKQGGGLPPIRDDKRLEPLIQKCLNPLPIKEAKTKAVPNDKRNYKGTKIVSKNASLNQEFAEESKDENIVKLGER